MDVRTRVAFNSHCTLICCKETTCIYNRYNASFLLHLGYADDIALFSLDPFDLQD